MTLKRLFGFSACAAALAAGLAVVGQSIGGGILSEQDWGISKLFAQTALPRPAACRAEYHCKCSTGADIGPDTRDGGSPYRNDRL
jgi:hypothetical protein